jgi:hypothetical protein
MEEHKPFSATLAIEGFSMNRDCEKIETREGEVSFAMGEVTSKIRVRGPDGTLWSIKVPDGFLQSLTEHWAKENGIDFKYSYVQPAPEMLPMEKKIKDLFKKLDEANLRATDLFLTKEDEKTLELEIVMCDSNRELSRRVMIEGLRAVCNTLYGRKVHWDSDETYAANVRR